MPHDNDLRVADVMGDAAIASEIPDFNLDHDTGQEAIPHHDDAHVIDVEATTIRPARRKKTAITAALALVAILVIISFAFLRHASHAQQPQNPDLAAIIQEAKTVPPLAGRNVDSLNASQAKPPLSTSAPAGFPPQQSPSAIAATPLQATTILSSPPASSEPAKTKSADNATTAALSNAPQQMRGGATSSTPNPAVVLKADYDVLVSERDAIAKERDKAQADLAALKAEKAAASTKEVVRVPEHEAFTVKAVLADGVVLQNAVGKVVVAPTGARVTVDGKTMAVSR